MQCYTELTPPTAVTHSLTLSFLSPNANNLIVAKTSLLQIFSLRTISEESGLLLGQEEQSAKESSIADRRINDDDGLEASFLGTDSIPLRSNHLENIKLVLVAEYTLSGTVTSLVRVKPDASENRGDLLLVGFKDAKLSLVEWDHERHGLSTISIHLYEQEELNGSPWAPKLGDCVNYLTVDPSSRCAALKFGARNLAILPFRQGDEDLAMDDWDEELDGPRPEKISEKSAGEDTKMGETPYGSSFVLRLSSLDPSLIFPVHLAFLHEYREPTFGILSSTRAPSAALLHERKDHLSYMVFTLDLDQRASTTILSVGGLPYDLFKVVALPAPVGGALLVGGNELIHIDQAGKANGVGVNPFAKQCTSFGLADQSELEMRLEGCMIEQLTIENGEMLIILNTGELAILSFRMDGRSVSGLNVRRVSTEAGGDIIKARASSISTLGRTSLFVGSENADSLVLGWTRRSNQVSRRKSRPDNIAGDGMEGILSEEEIEEDDPEDDLYGDGPTAQPAAAAARADASNSRSGDYVFRIHDSLINTAPMTDTTLGKVVYHKDSEELRYSEGVSSDLQLVAVSGRDRSGSLAVLEREISPKVVGRFDFPEARGIWTVSAKRPATKGLQADKSDTTMNGDDGVEAQFDHLMIVSKASQDDTDESAVYALTSAGFEALTGTEFEPAAGATIEVGTLGNGMRVIQVLKSEVRSYDGGKFSIFYFYPLPSNITPLVLMNVIMACKGAEKSRYYTEQLFNDGFNGSILESMACCKNTHNSQMFHSIMESIYPACCIALSMIVMT
jgi:cleavage and polyadenylation specificity factor subunit 1